MPLLPMLLLLADPVAGPLKSFGDWAVACDNVKRCEMTSLVPGETGFAEEGSLYDTVWMSVERVPGPQGGYVVEVQIPSGETGSEVSVRVDDQVVTGMIPSKDFLYFSGAEAAQIVAAMVKGKHVTITDIGGATIGRISLAGSSAALRFIDAEQGRADTVSAAVAKGSKPASGVPAAIAAPAVARVKPGGAAAAITPALAETLFRISECGANYESDRPEVEAQALGDGASLALVPCGAGAYNYLSVPYVIRGGKPVIAAFDFVPGFTEDPGSTPMLVNAQFDPVEGRLTSYSKGRGVGDCGSAEDYVWDGTRFRAVEVRQMTECRGSVNWLRVWTAKPAP